MIQQQTSSASALPDRAAHYLGLLEEHEHRGVSLRSFAGARGLSVWTLYGWRRRLGLTRPRATTSSSGLVAVDIVDDRPASRTAAGEQLEVIFGDGLRLPSNVTVDRLAEVVTALRSC